MDGDPVPSQTRKGSETWPTSINAEPAAGAGQVFSLRMLGHFPYGPLRPENAACRRGQLRAWALGESASTFLPFYQRICVTVTRRLFPKTKWQGFLFTLCDPSALWPMLQKMLSFYHRSFPHSLQSSLEDSEGPSDGLVTNYFLTSLPFDTVGNLVR